MPTIPYTSQVSARSLRTGGAQLPMTASPEAYGAGIGRAVQELGRATSDTANVLQQMAEQESREKAASAVATNTWAQREAALKLEMAADPTGYSSRVQEEYRNYIEESANGLEDNRARKMYREQMLGNTPNVIQRAVNDELTQRVEHSKGLANDGLNSLQNKIAQDPTQYDMYLKQGDDILVNAPGMSAGMKEVAGRMWRYNAAKTRFEGMLSKASTPETLDGIAAELSNEDGKGRDWTGEMLPADYMRLVDDINTQKKVFEGQYKSEATAYLSQLEERTKEDPTLIPTAELQSAQEVVKRSSDSKLAARMARVMRDQSIIRSEQRLPPAQLREIINDRSSDQPAGEYDAMAPSWVAYEDNELRQKILNRMEKALADDPVSFANSTGTFKVLPLDQEGAFAARGQAVKAISEYYNIPMSQIKPFTADEVAYLKRQFDEDSPDKSLDFMLSIQSMGKESSRAAMKQLGEKDPVWSHAGNLYMDGNKDAAADVMRGSQKIRENPAILGQLKLGKDSPKIDTAMVSRTGVALSQVPALRQAVQDSSVAYYVQRYGATGADANDGDIKRSIDAVLGATSDYKPIDRVNGLDTYMPKGISSDEMEAAFERISFADMQAMSDDGSLPRHIDGSQLDVSDMAGRVKLRYVGKGGYALAYDDGTYVLGKDAQTPYIFVPDVKRLKDLANSPAGSPPPPPSPAPIQPNQPGVTEGLTKEEMQAAPVEEPKPAAPAAKPKASDINKAIKESVPREYAGDLRGKSVAEELRPTIKTLVDGGVQVASIKQTIKGYYDQFSDQVDPIAGSSGGTVKEGTARRKGKPSRKELKSLLEALKVGA